MGRLVYGCYAAARRLRLDANQAWDVEQAREFYTALRSSVGGGAARAMEFCEEPLRASLHAALPALYADHCAAYAYDESLTPLAAAAEATAAKEGGTAGHTALLGALRSRLSSSAGDRSGCVALVLKPSLLGGLEVSAAFAEEAHDRGLGVVLTSAFESGVAHAHIAIAAAVLGGASVAHGLSTYERLAEDTLHPPFAQSVVGGDLVSIASAQAALDETADLLDVGARAATA